MKKNSTATTELQAIAQLPVQRVRLVADAEVHYSVAAPTEAFTTFENLNKFFTAAMAGASVEEFWCVALDSAMRPITAFRPEEGIANQAVVYPQKIMRQLLLACASSFVVAHNHPSGEARPSLQDKELTRALQAAAQTLQMRMIDHVIITPQGEAYSFRRDGQI